MMIVSAKRKRQLSKVRKALFEGLVIFIAVILGFFADDIRESKNTVKQKNNVLMAIYSDLETDRKFALMLSETLESSAQDALSFYTTVTSPDRFTGDTVEQQLTNMLNGAPLSQNRGGYESGKAQNLITQIETRALQIDITNYYESTSAHLRSVNDMVVTEFTQFLDVLTVTTELDPYAGGSVLGKVVIKEDISAQQLKELRATVYAYASFSRLFANQLRYYADQMSAIQRAINAELEDYDLVVN